MEKIVGPLSYKTNTLTQRANTKIIQFQKKPQNLKKSNQYLTILISQNSDFKDTKTDLLYRVHPGKKKNLTEWATIFQFVKSLWQTQKWNIFLNVKEKTESNSFETSDTITKKQILLASKKLERIFIFQICWQSESNGFFKKKRLLASIYIFTCRFLEWLSGRAGDGSSTFYSASFPFPCTPKVCISH